MEDLSLRQQEHALGVRINCPIFFVRFKPNLEFHGRFS